jgi:hypothetical protein
MTLTSLLIAQSPGDPMQSLQQAFRNQRPGEVSPFTTTAQFLVVMLVVLAALYAVIRVTQRRGMSPAARNPRRFFTQVLKQLHAGPMDRLVMHRAARHAGLEHPAMMLVSSELLEKYAGGWADTISIRFLREHVRRRIARIGAIALGP